MGRKRTLTPVPDGEGRPLRDLEARARILDATLRLLGEHGYARLTIEGVARAAGASKATIYRSWPGKTSLVLDAVREELDEVPDEDLGDSRAELLAVAHRALARFYASPRVQPVLLALTAEAAQDPELAVRLREEIVQPRHARTRAVLRRAVERGDLPADTDVSLVLQMWAGAMLARALLFAEPVDERTVTRMVDAALASPPRLPG